MKRSEAGLRYQLGKVWPYSSRLASEAKTELKYFGMKLFLLYQKKVIYPLLLQTFEIRHARPTFWKNCVLSVHSLA